jgi:hypothetical protein
MLFRNIIYAFTCLLLSIVTGGAVYEHMVVVPKWSAAPPASLSMLQGPYGLDAAPFWQTIHPITLLFFIITLIISWKTPRRKNVLIAMGFYVAVLAVTAIYFVPELISIVTTPYSDTIDAALTKRAKLWEMLSIVRLVFIIGFVIVLMLGLTKSAQRHGHTA